jgi:hypothetical protein
MGNIPGLGSWTGVETDPFAAVGRVTGHARFAEASRALASSMLALAADDRVLDAIFHDAGRYFATMWGFALHERGGLTLPRLKAVCVDSGLLSPGRARALVQLLEYYGYLARAGACGGATAYAPTPAFRAAWDRQFVAALDAAHRLEPTLARFLDPAAADLRQAYGRIHAEGLLSAMRGESTVGPFLRVFLHPYAGNHVIWTLIGRAEGGVFPPVRAGPVSIAGLARDTGASRSQIARIFREAREAELADLEADGFVRFAPAAREQLAFFYAFQLAQILTAAARAAGPAALTIKFGQLRAPPRSGT